MVEGRTSLLVLAALQLRWHLATSLHQPDLLTSSILPAESDAKVAQRPAPLGASIDLRTIQIRAVVAKVCWSTARCAQVELIAGIRTQYADLARPVQGDRE
jgi:hypothetical protein